MTKNSRFTSNAFRLAVLALAVASSGSAIAANAVANSTSTVITAINIAKSADLAFGSFAATAAAGTVTITPAGGRTSTGVVEVASTPGAAKFDVTGQSGMGYSISVVATALSDGASNSMTFTPISALTASTATSGTVSAGTLTGGAQSIYVGGVLSVAANQVAGSYSGTVTATVDYN